LNILIKFVINKRFGLKIEEPNIEKSKYATCHHYQCLAFIRKQATHLSRTNQQQLSFCRQKININIAFHRHQQILHRI
jgi:hypothetical protein